MATERPAKAKRILVVEDEPMIRMLLEDMLSELGYTVAAEAAGIEEALEATKNADFDLAILDADLKGQPALPVADALVTRGTPFVFATGYGEVPEPYRGRPMLACGDTWEGERGAESPCAPLLFRGATPFEFHMFVASNHHRQDRYPATCGCTKSSIDGSRVIGPAKSCRRP